MAELKTQTTVSLNLNTMPLAELQILAKRCDDPDDMARHYEFAERVRQTLLARLSRKQNQSK